MKRQRQTIVRRRPVFLGCEGESERAYAQVIADLIRQRVKDVHLEVMLLGPGAGSPLAKIHKTLKLIESYERKRSEFWRKFVLIDYDLAEHDEKLRTETSELATSNGIMLIWQRPCHEAFLLRHLPNCADQKPQSPTQSIKELVAIWPQYRKSMTRYQVARRIDSASLERARSVESELHHFLNMLGWT